MPISTVILCPDCQKPNASGLTHCGFCNTSLETVSCSRCGHVNPVTAPLCTGCYADLRQKICPHCQARNLRVATSCVQCDQLFYEPRRIVTPISVRPETPISPKSVLYIILIFIYIFLFLGTLLFAYSDRLLSPTMAVLCAVTGSVFVPVVLSVVIWAVWANRHIARGTFLGALLSGATIGIVASLILYIVVPTISLAFAAILILPVIIGASEELGKALSLAWLLKSDRYHTELHGLAFGILAGLGFSALENVGYTLRAYNMEGSRQLAYTVLIRMGASLAHAMWTGCLCAILWRERRVTPQFTAPVLHMYISVVLLHAFWDYMLIAYTSEQGYAVLAGSALITIPLFAVRLRSAYEAFTQVRNVPLI